MLTRTMTPERIRGNIGAVELELTDEDMRAIAALNRDERVGPDPSRFNG